MVEFRKVEEGMPVQHTAGTDAPRQPWEQAVPVPRSPVEAMSALADKLQREAVLTPAPAPPFQFTSQPRAVMTLARFLWMGEYLASGLSMVDWFAGLDANRKRYADGALAAILDG